MPTSRNARGIDLLAYDASLPQTRNSRLKQRPSAGLGINNGAQRALLRQPAPPIFVLEKASRAAFIPRHHAAQPEALA